VRPRSTVGTRTTTGAGARCTTTENTSYSTRGSATVSPTSRPEAAAAATARSVRAARSSAVSITLILAVLQDESVSPLAIRRLVQRHPKGADPVFRTLLRKPGFSWERDGEELLRRRKKTFFDHEPTPSISTVGNRLVELLHTGR